MRSVNLSVEKDKIAHKHTDKEERTLTGNLRCGLEFKETQNNTQYRSSDDYFSDALTIMRKRTSPQAMRCVDLSSGSRRITHKQYRSSDD